MVLAGVHWRNDGRDGMATTSNSGSCAVIQTDLLG